MNDELWIMLFAWVLRVLIWRVTYGQCDVERETAEQKTWRIDSDALTHDATRVKKTLCDATLDTYSTEHYRLCVRLDNSVFCLWEHHRLQSIMFIPNCIVPRFNSRSNQLRCPQHVVLTVRHSMGKPDQKGKDPDVRTLSGRWSITNHDSIPKKSRRASLRNCTFEIWDEMRSTILYS